jgi:hypothetical protein
VVELNTYCLSWLLPWIYTSSSSMDHRMSSLLILVYIIGSLRLIESTFPSTSLLSFAIYTLLPPSNRVHASILLSSAKRHKSFSNFLLIDDFFLSLLLLSLFMIDFDFGLSCNSFHMICLMYFILSCVLSNTLFLARMRSILVFHALKLEAPSNLFSDFIE